MSEPAVFTASAGSFLEVKAVTAVSVGWKKLGMVRLGAPLCPLFPLWLALPHAIFPQFVLSVLPLNLLW